jgi:hypothetical protein
MTLLLGAVLGAPLGASAVLAAVLRETVAHRWTTATGSLRRLRGGHHARLLSRPRPLRLLAHGAHEPIPTPSAAASDTAAA